MGCRKFLSALVLLGAVLTGCNQQDTVIADIPDHTASKTVTPPVLSAEMDKAIASEYDAGILLFKRMVEKNEGDNIIFSPYCFYTAISMLSNGADVQVAAEIADFLGIADINFLNSTASILANSIEILDEDVTLNIANALWTDISMSVRSDFSSVLTQHYKTEQFKIDYGNNDATDVINAWISKQTNGKIPEFYKNRQSGPVNLVNAVYFNGGWSVPFNSDNVAKLPFKTPDKPEMVWTMTAPEMPAYYASADFGRTLTLPFGNGAYRMTAVLPPEDVDIHDYITALDGPALRLLATPGDSKSVLVSLPVFSFQTDVKFNEILAEAGCGSMFTDRYWPGITEADMKLQLGELRQASTFAISPEGAEAASVTGAIIFTAPGPENEDNQNPRFIADRPFLFIVTECGCNTPIFLGLVQRP